MKLASLSASSGPADSDSEVEVEVKTKMKMADGISGLLTFLLQREVRSQPKMQLMNR